jgi:hypothetical protein
MGRNFGRIVSMSASPLSPAHSRNLLTIGQLNIPFLRRIESLFAEEVKVTSTPLIADFFAENPRSIVVCQHGRLMAWILFGSSAALYCHDNGGADRIPFAVSHRVFDNFPPARRLLDHILPNAGSLGVEELVSAFTAGYFSELVLSPEGDNCNFGDGMTITDFRSPRFIELAIRADAPLILMTHTGTENWGQRINVPQRVRPLCKLLPYSLYDRIEEHGHIIFPLIRRASQVKIHLQSYSLELQREELSTDPAQRQEQLWQEAHRVRRAMQTQLDTMR